MPCVKDIGLWGERLQQAYVDMGVFEMGDSNLDLLMAQDEEIAEQLDAERFAAEEAERTAEVADAIAEGERLTGEHSTRPRVPLPVRARGGRSGPPVRHRADPGRPAVFRCILRVARGALLDVV